MHSQQYCAYHPSFQIVNFCRSNECLLPLCQKCVKIHSAEHANAGTFGNFDNIQDLHEEVQDNLQKTLKNVLELSERLKENYLREFRRK